MNAAPQALDLGSLASFAFYILLAGAIVAVIVYAGRFFGGLGKLEGDVSNVEADFERQLREAATKGGLSGEQPLPAPPANPQPAAVVTSITTPPSTEANTPEEFAKRLQALRIVEHVEGRIPMPMPPDGLIYRLRSGGLAAILPRLESAEFMNFQSRKYDKVFVLSGAGEILVVERFQQRLPELLDLNEDGGGAKGLPPSPFR